MAGNDKNRKPKPPGDNSSPGMKQGGFNSTDKAQGTATAPPFSPGKNQPQQEGGFPGKESQGFGNDPNGMQQGMGMEPIQAARLTPMTEEERSAAQAMLKVYTRRYDNVSPMYGLRRGNVLDYNQPLFFRYYIPAMERDPHLVYGIKMLRAPILTKAKYEVTSDMPEVQDFVDKQIKRFWAVGLPLSLTSMEWGFNGAEVIYRWKKKTQLLEFDKLRFLRPHDVTPVVRNGSLQGILIRRIRDPGNNSPNQEKFLKLPKVLWSVHEKRHDRWFGKSVYEGAFIPWYETWQPKGFRNIRHLAMYKYSFDGGCVKYPEGATQDPITGENIPNVLIAEQMADRREAGATLVLPSLNQEYGGWEYEPAAGMTIPEGLFQYGDDLRNEKWEGIGVPPEIVQDESGGSFAGRRVPQQGFYSAIQEKSDEQLFDFDEQVLRYLVRLNFGPDADYDVEAVPIIQTLQQEEMGVVTGKLPGDEEEDPAMMEEDGTENQLSNGRIEDRGSNSFNKKEKAIAANSKK